MKENNSHPEYQYLDLLRDVLDTGVKNTDRGTGSVSYSVFGRQIRFDLSKGFPLLTTKKVYWKGVLHELYWFVSGQSNIKYLVDNNVHIWDDYPWKIFHNKNKESGIKTKEEFIEKIRTDEQFAEKWGNLAKIYGESWRRWPTRDGRVIDQLAWLIQELKDDPDARNLIVTSWNPEYLYTMATREDTSWFPICHNMYQFSQKGGKLNLQMYQRSADLFLGVPFNIASYSLLLLIISHITGYEPGEFIHTLGDAHIYENHKDQVKEQLTRTPKEFPTVTLNPSVKTIDDLKTQDISLDNYDPHPSLNGELTIAGGFYEKAGK